MQDSFKNMFPRDEKIKLAVAGVSENERRKWFSLATKSVLLARIRLFIINCISWFPLLAEKKKNLLFQLNRKSVSTRVNGEFV